MAETYKTLAQELVASSNDELYTVPANTTTIVRHIRVVNVTSSTATIKLFHGGTGTANMILPFVNIAGNGWAEYDGTIIMEAASVLTGISGTNDAINCTIYGLELT